MALSLGTLFVKLNADPSQLVKGLDQTASKIEQFGNRLKNTSEKLTQLGMAMSAAGVGAVAVAAQFDSGVKASLDELKATSAAISVELGRAFIPAMEKLNSVLTFFGNLLKNIDPDTKAAVATFVAMSGVVLLVAGGIAKLVAIGMQLAPLFATAIAPAIKAVSAAFLPLLALLAAVLVFVPLIADEWTNFTTFMKNSWNKAMKSIASAWEGVKGWFFETVNAIGQAWSKFTGKLWELFAWAMKKVGKYTAKIAEQFGLDWSNGLEAFNATMDDMASQGFQPLVDMSKDAGVKIGAFLGESIDYASNMIVPGYQRLADKIVSGSEKIKNGIKGMFDGLFEGMDKPLEGLSLLTHGVEQPPKAREAETMTFEAIDVYGKVGKKAAETTATWEAGVKLAGDNLLQGLGSFTELMNAAQAGFAAGGPWGAVAAVAAELLMKSQSFMTLVEQVNGFIQIVADQLGAVLGPNFYILGAVLKAIAPVVKILMQVLGGPLFLSLKALGLVVLGIVWALGIAWNAIIDVVSWIFNTIGDALNLIWGGLGDGMKGIAASMRAGMVDIAGVENDMRTLANMSMDQGGNLDAKGTKPIEVLGAAASETASTLNDLNASLTNIPAGFKIAAARFNATAPSIYDFGLGGNMQEVEVNLNLDGKQIHKAIVIANARGQYISRGGTPPPKWWGA